MCDNNSCANTYCVYALVNHRNINLPEANEKLQRLAKTDIPLNSDICRLHEIFIQHVIHDMFEFVVGGKTKSY